MNWILFTLSASLVLAIAWALDERNLRKAADADATKWRLSRAARVQRDARRAQAQRQPVIAKMVEMQEGR